MKEIVIVSGKGGVGKTTISASLALLFHRKGSRIVAADYDVDAPNLALVLEGLERNRETIAATEIAVVDPEKCNSCGLCIDACKFDAIKDTNSDGVPKILEMFCEGCGACAVVCPVEAVDMREAESGVIREIHSKFGFPVVVGQLKIGGTGSGKIVVETRNRARQLVKKINADLMIADGPPGVGCPAIAAVSNADYVILITEPTPAAKHDLERIVLTVNHFGHPAGLVLNKADLYEPIRAELLRFVKNSNIDLLGEIPLDDSVPASIANAAPVVEDQPSSRAAAALVNVFRRLADILD
ncbi:MAG: P-loop NTPase [Promethearchaeota archaeon]